MAILAEQGVAMQFRRSVTYVAGLFCYRSTRAIPRRYLTLVEADVRSDGARVARILYGSHAASVNRRPASSTNRTCRKDLFNCPCDLRAAAQPSVRALL